MRHAHFVFIALGACLLSEQTRANAAGESVTPPPSVGFGNMPRFNAEKMSRDMLLDSLQKEVTILNKLHKLLASTTSAEPIKTDLSKELDSVLTELNELMEKRPTLMEHAKEAAIPMARNQLPDKRSLYVLIDQERQKLLADESQLSDTLRQQLRTLPIETVSEKERLEGRDEKAALILEMFNAFSSQRDILKNIKDEQSAKAAIALLNESRTRVDRADQALMASGDAYLTREDMDYIRTPYRNGWEALRLELNAERERILAEDCYGVTELSPVLPR